MAVKPKIPTTPPEHLPERVAVVWRELVDGDALAASVTPQSLEAYVTLIAQYRDAARRVDEEGIVVDGERRGPITHPALALMQQLAQQIATMAPKFHRAAEARRRRGPMTDATKASVKAAEHLTDEKYRGAVLAAETLAWLIDEAQRAGIDALTKASYVLIPSYLKACSELQITPASLPAEAAGKKVTGGGKVTKFSDAAARRRAQAG